MVDFLLSSFVDFQILGSFDSLAIVLSSLAHFHFFFKEKRIVGLKVCGSGCFLALSFSLCFPSLSDGWASLLFPALPSVLLTSSSSSFCFSSLLTAHLRFSLAIFANCTLSREDSYRDHQDHCESLRILVFLKFIEVVCACLFDHLLGFA